MHYIIYKITNQINGKYYIGKYISRGKHKGFLIEQLSTYKEAA